MASLRPLAFTGLAPRRLGKLVTLVTLRFQLPHAHQAWFTGGRG